MFSFLQDSDDEVKMPTVNFEDNDESPEELLLYYSRHGNAPAVKNLVQKLHDKKITLDINCKGNLNL